MFMMEKFGFMEVLEGFEAKCCIYLGFERLLIEIFSFMQVLERF